MREKALWLCMLLLILPALPGQPCAVADTSTGSTPDFVPARPGYEYAFPRDHGSHDHFQTEWWYFTGHLADTSGRRFGYELTFFRRGIDSPDVRNNPSAWAIRHLYLAHFALTDEAEERFLVAEKLSRAGIQKAGAREGTLDVWIDQWSVRAVTPDHRQFHLQAQTDEFAIDLTVEPLKAPVIHGLQGVSRKGQHPTETSHYYSLTRLRTTGSVVLQGQRVAVQGQSWMDHEFGSADLADNLVGWDWFSLQLDNQHEIMAYGLRRADGSFDPASSGTLVRPDGTTEFLTFDHIDIEVRKHWTSPVSGATYPNHWRFSIPSQAIDLQISPRMAQQELVTQRSTGVTYWEGSVDVSGRWKQKAIEGKGYVEMTGYAEPYDPD